MVSTAAVCANMEYRDTSVQLLLSARVRAYTLFDSAARMILLVRRACISLNARARATVHLPVHESRVDNNAQE
eukprot:191263-Pleurochrysis_carterae.AAC.1